MITGWQILKLCIGDWVVTDVEAKLDLTYTKDSGWQLAAVIIEDYADKPIRIERDGSVKLNDDHRLHAYMASSIVAAAVCHFEDVRDEILNECGALDDVAA